MERALKALKHFALPAQQMPYSSWQSDLWLCSIYTLGVTSGPARVRNARMRRGKVTPALCQHGGGVLISALLLKRRCDVLVSPRLGSCSGPVALDLAARSVRIDGSVNRAVRRSGGSSGACRIAVDTAVTALKSAVQLEVACWRHKQLGLHCQTGAVFPGSIFRV